MPWPLYRCYDRTAIQRVDWRRREILPHDIAYPQANNNLRSPRTNFLYAIRRGWSASGPFRRFRCC